MVRKILAATLLASLPLASWGQLVSGIKVEPAEIKTGESAKITVTLDVTGGVNCGLRVHFGDGQTQDFKLNQTKDVPLVLTRKYEQAGDLRVKAEPKTQGMLPKCGGKNQEAALKVTAPPAPPAAAKGAAPATKGQANTAAAKAPAPSCPPDWTLDAKSVNRKTGAFTCTAKAGTKVPGGKLACPGDLSYFENEKKGQLGCRP